VCGNKQISELNWNANETIPTENIYAFQTYSTLTANASTVISENTRANRPVICPLTTFYEGPTFDIRTDIYSDFNAH
jgi:hypothetical protein